jgi:Protein of unknown function (DUF4054)
MTIVACSDTPITPGVVQFIASEFLSLYPQFTPQAAALAGNFGLATTQLNNGCGSAVQDANLRQTLLYLLTAHITQLLNGVGSTAATGLVGRVSDASEGSVSVTAEWTAAGGPSQSYLLQTPFGAAFWQSTAIFRTAKYFSAPPNPCDTSYPYGFFGNGGYGGGCGCP